jgi:hypothetical protein
VNGAQRDEVCEFREDDINELVEGTSHTQVDIRVDALDIGLELIQAYGQDEAWMLSLAQAGDKERFRNQMEQVVNGNDLSHLSLRGLVRLHDTVFDTELVDKVNWQAVDKPEHEAEAK